MNDWKKYEMYIEKKLAGILHVNMPVLKKATALSLAGIISVSTLTGCKTYSYRNLKDKSMVATNKKIDSLDIELESKLEFIEETLNDIKNNLILEKIMEPYKNAKRKLSHLEPEIDEYYNFYTQEDIIKIKESALEHLDCALELIYSLEGRNYYEEIDVAKKNS